MWNTPATSRERYPEIFSSTDGLCDVTDTYPYMEPETETSSEQPNISPSNPLNSKCNLRHNRILNAMTTTYNDSCTALVGSTERKSRPSRNFSNALRNQSIARQKRVIFSSGFSLATNSIATH